MILLFIYILFSLFISRITLNLNIFNTASFCLISYWAAYPFDKLELGPTGLSIYQRIDYLKEIGIYLYAIFGFAFLIGALIIRKNNYPKIKFYSKINSENNLIFISIFLGALGLLCFSYTYNFDINQYISLTLGLARGERMSLISNSNNALPYSIFFIPSVTTLLIWIKKTISNKSFLNLFFAAISFLINIPILLSYFFEGDRSALIKFIAILIFTLGLTKKSSENKKEKNYLITKKGFNKKVLINRIKIIIIVLTFVSFLTFIELSRGNGWRNTSQIFTTISRRYKSKNLPIAEFRGVNYTIDFALARDLLSIEKTNKMFTWDKLIFYPLPRNVYKSILNEKKPINIGDAIGSETKNYLYGKKYKNHKFGFGLSPIAEGYINFGYIGVFITGLIYGLAIGILQSFYNKISIDKISLIDIFVLNTLGIVPLIMRAGTAGIYNWIFSTSFVILLPLLLLEIFQQRKLIQINRERIDENQK